MASEGSDDFGPRFAELFDVHTREPVDDAWRAVDALDSYTHVVDYSDDGRFRKIEETRVLEQHVETGEYRVNVVKAVERYD